MSETTEPKEDLTYGEDVRGDHALFIERKHINGWDLDEEAQAFTEGKSPTFGFGLKCRFNALLARVSTSFFVRWTLKI